MNIVVLLCSAASVIASAEVAAEAVSLLQRTADLARRQQFQKQPVPTRLAGTGQGRVPLEQKRIETFVTEACGGPCKKCSSYSSVIRLGGRGVSGLGDRLTDISTWSGLAALLCARIQLRPPCEKVLKYQVGNMSREVAWSKFIDVVAADGSKMTDPPDAADTRVKIPMKGSFEERYALAKKAVADGKPFDWTLDFDWLSIPWGQTLPPGDLAILTAESEIHRKACHNFAIRPSAETLEAASKFRSELGLTQRHYATLHVRRGDAKVACDTSVAKVSAYASCSLGKSVNMTLAPLILFTDEVDPEYLAALHGNLSKVFGGLRKVILGDRVLDAVMGQEATDGLMGGPLSKYTTSLLLRFQSSVELLLDRSHCVACDVVPKPTVHCSGTCDFQEYVVQQQFHTSSRAHDAAVVRLKRDHAPACAQQALAS